MDEQHPNMLQIDPIPLEALVQVIDPPSLETAHIPAIDNKHQVGLPSILPERFSERGG